MEELKKTEPRLDVELLEQRAERLYTQLDKHRDYKTYAPTRHRLMAVKRKLTDCIEILNKLTKEDEAKALFRLVDPVLDTDSLPVPNIDSTSIAKIEARLSYLENQLKVSGKSSEPVKTSSSKLRVDTKPTSSYTSSFIVSQFCTRIHNCSSKAVMEGFGIIEINQLSKLFDSWYTAKFHPDFRKKDFRFKAVRIAEWIDWFILSAGYSIADGKFLQFRSEVEEWINQLSIDTSPSHVYPVPCIVSQVNTYVSYNYTKQAVLIESILKPYLYDTSFYPEKLHSIRQIVMQQTGLSESDLSVRSILNGNHGFVVTSSFDWNRYNDSSNQE